MNQFDPKELVESLQRGVEHTERLLQENAELKAKLAGATAGASGSVPAATDELLRTRVDALERENREFASRYVEIEEENNNLANLYVASYQLHSTLDFREVLRVITEIVINLIGAETFAIYLVDEKTSSLSAVASEGVTRDELPKVTLGKGRLGSVAESGQNHFPEEVNAGEIDWLEPHVCIPLKIKEKVIGVIAIYRFLEQKTRLHSVDYELFTLLAGHAATALFSSKLYSESERKLSTIQGFLELMTS